MYYLILWGDTTQLVDMKKNRMVRCSQFCCCHIKIYASVSTLKLRSEHYCDSHYLPSRSKSRFQGSTNPPPARTRSRDLESAFQLFAQFMVRGCLILPFTSAKLKKPPLSLWSDLRLSYFTFYFSKIEEAVPQFMGRFKAVIFFSFFPLQFEVT